MVRRLCILCILVALWPGFALAQSRAFKEAFDRFSASYAQGHYLEAERYVRRALKLGEKEFGPAHTKTATLLNGLAIVLANQGHFDKAEPLHKRALAIREKALGRNHPDVAQSLRNLAQVYHAQGRTAKAEAFAKRALAIEQKSPGDSDPLFNQPVPPIALSPGLALAQSAALDNAYNQYQALDAQGRYAEAEPFARKALELVKREFGPDRFRLPRLRAVRHCR